MVKDVASGCAWDHGLSAGLPILPQAFTSAQCVTAGAGRCRALGLGCPPAASLHGPLRKGLSHNPVTEPPV